MSWLFRGCMSFWHHRSQTWDVGTLFGINGRKDSALNIDDTKINTTRVIILKILGCGTPFFVSYVTNNIASFEDCRIVCEIAMFYTLPLIGLVLIQYVEILVRGQFESIMYYDANSVSKIVVIS